jgi:hypothetical protein
MCLLISQPVSALARNLLQSRREATGFEAAFFPRQVTPVLGIMHDLHARRKALEAGTGQFAKDPPPPEHVHLIFAASSQAELALLDCSLLDDARCAKTRCHYVAMHDREGDKLCARLHVPSHVMAAPRRSSAAPRMTAPNLACFGCFPAVLLSCHVRSGPGRAAGWTCACTRPAGTRRRRLPPSPRPAPPRTTAPPTSPSCAA